MLLRLIPFRVGIAAFRCSLEVRWEVYESWLVQKLSSTRFRLEHKAELNETVSKNDSISQRINRCEYRLR